MPEPKKPSVARLAVDTIKEAKEAGEEIGRMIQEINEANERTVREYHMRVLRERRAARQHDRELDQRALNEWLAEQERERNKAQVREEVERTYGRGSWEKIEATKARMVQTEEEDKRHADEMRLRMNDLLWWCLGAAALITYAFRLYKS
jgi:hypothetical protein